MRQANVGTRLFQLVVNVLPGDPIVLGAQTHRLSKECYFDKNAVIYIFVCPVAKIRVRFNKITQKDFTGSRIRCGTEKELVDDKCKRDNIEL